MKKPLHLLSLFLLVAVSFVMSCSKDDPKPDACDGTLTVALDSKTNLTTCTANDGSITVSASGGNEPYQYSLNGGAKQTSATFSGLSAGTYSITVFDSKNCEDTETGISIIASGTDLDVTPVVTPDTDCSASNGAISLTGSGGNTTAAYQYQLNSNAFQLSGSFSGLAPGTYTVRVKDASGCIISKSVEVTQGSTGVTYTSNILPIFNQKCAFSGCHPANGDWMTYLTAKNKAAAIKSRTASGGGMPPSGSSGGALSSEQIALIACWVNDGAPQ